jgi:uncharacterized phage infection (PIP) family protein YhgE
LQELQETQATAESESASLETLQTAMAKIKADLEAAQKELKDTKDAADKLKRQLSAAMKDLKQTKTALADANQTIDQLKATLAVKPAADEQPSVSPDLVPASPTLTEQSSPPLKQSAPPAAPANPADENRQPSPNEPGTFESKATADPTATTPTETPSDRADEARPVPVAVE